MFRFFDKADYDFLRVRRFAYLATGLIAVLGLADLALRGLNESIEFTGGALIQIHATDPAVTIGRLRGALAANGITGVELNTFGTEHDFELRAPITAGAGSLRGRRCTTAPATWDGGGVGVPMRRSSSSMPA